MRQLRIIQSSPPGTGSTVVVNLIHGVLAPDERINWDTAKLIDECMITKTHDINLDAHLARYPRYDLYFIVTEREDYKKFDERYRHYERVLFIDYDEILETYSNTLESVVERFYEKLRSFLPHEVFPSISDDEIRARAVARIRKMNAVVAELSDMPHSHFEPFFHVHGSHRNRSAKRRPETQKSPLSKMFFWRKRGAAL